MGRGRQHRRPRRSPRLRHQPRPGRRLRALRRLRGSRHMVKPSPQSASSTPVGAGNNGGAEPSWPLTTRQGWHRFATTDPVTPPRPGDPPRSTEERLAYHSSFVTIRTPAISTLATQVRTLMILGRHQQTTARPSLIVTGPAAAGKTTALLNVGRTCHLAHTRKNPAAARISPHRGTRRLCSRPARRHRENPRHRVRPLPRHPRGRPHDPDPDHRRRLPHLHPSWRPTRPHRRDPPPQPPHHHRRPNRRPAQRPQRTPARDLCLRIDVTDTPLFTGTRGAQLAGRATLITCGPLPARHGTRRPFTDVITDVITDIENNLDLQQHTPGTLPRHAPYLHQRTAGRIGSSPASSAKPPSPPSATAPNASPKPHSTPSASTTSPKPTTAPLTHPLTDSGPDQHKHALGLYTPELPTTNPASLSTQHTTPAHTHWPHHPNRSPRLSTNPQHTSSATASYTNKPPPSVKCRCAGRGRKPRPHGWPPAGR